MKNKIFKYGVAISAFLGCIILNNPLLIKDNIIPISLLVCQFINVILGVTGFVMALININYEENNPISVLAYGYFLMVLIALVNIYVYIGANRGVIISANYYRNRLLMHMLEGVYIYIALNIVDQKHRVQVWMKFLSVISLIAFCMVIKGGDILHLKTDFSYGIVCFIAMALMILARYRCYKYQVYGDDFHKIEKAITFKVLYLLGVISGKMAFNSLWMLGCYIIDTIHYVYIYEFIYEVIKKRFWGTAGQCLDNTKSELEQEEIEKHNLVFASYALKEYVNAINHEATVLKKKMESNCGSKSLAHLEKIKKNCMRLMKLSNNILDLGQMDIGNVAHHYKPTNMNQLIEVLVESILPYVESRGLQIEIKKGEKPVYCYVDSDDMERVLLNLISNAIKYSKSNGKISIYINEKQERAYICVEDTGVGIPEEKLKSIFERFERVESGFARTQEGSGLGLAIVKNIVEAHQGKINICSKEDKGTLVSLNLPIYQGQKNRQLDIRSKATLKRKIEVEFADLKR